MATEHRDLEAQRGERLPELVVQLVREAAPLVLVHLLEAARETPQIRRARVDLSTQPLVPALELARHRALLLAVAEDLPREEVHDVAEPDREDERVRVEPQRGGRLGRRPRVGLAQVPREHVRGADGERPRDARSERHEHRARPER